MSKQMICKGIVQACGFNVYPNAESPRYVQFRPNEETTVEDLVAEHLVKQDPHKFIVVEGKQPVTAGAAPAPTPSKQGESNVKNNRKKR